MAHNISVIDGRSKYASRARAAFTLVELLIVASIIAILALYAIPKYGAAFLKTKANECLATRRSIETAEKLYMQDNSDAMADIYELTDKGYLTKRPRCASGGTLLWVSTDPVHMGCSVHDIPGAVDTSTVTASTQTASSQTSSTTTAPSQSASTQTTSGVTTSTVPFSSVFSSLANMQVYSGDWSATFRDKLLNIAKGAQALIMADAGPYGDYTIDVGAAKMSASSTGYDILYHATVNASGNVDGYAFSVDRTAGDKFIISKITNGVATTLASASIPSGFAITNTNHDIKITTVGGTATVYVDGQKTITATDSTYATGGTGFMNQDGQVRFGSLDIQPK